MLGDVELHSLHGLQPFDKLLSNNTNTNTNNKNKNNSNCSMTCLMNHSVKF